MAAAVLLLASAGGATPAASAQTEGGAVATLEPSFSPKQPGAFTAVGLGIRFTAPPSAPGGLPAAVRKAVIWFPAGLAAPSSLSWPLTRGCSPAHLRARGARGCPPRSQIGSGSELLAWPEGSGTRTERARLKLFIGPTDGEYAFELLAEGRPPLRRRTVVTESLFAASAPWSAGMDVSIPPIPTRPGGPDATVLSLSVTIARVHGSVGLGERVPRSCPPGGYPWSATFTFADGSGQTANAAIPCP
jgi:hypothetical protein